MRGAGHPDRHPGHREHDPRGVQRRAADVRRPRSAPASACFAHGTTTVESKSGYGLSLAEEIKLLEVNRGLRRVQPVDVVSTFLGAHDFPPERAARRSTWTR